MQVTQEQLTRIADPTFLAAYEEWRRNPVTGRVIAFLQEASLNSRLPGAFRSEDALYYAGSTDAEREILAWLSSLSERVNDISALRKAASAQQLESTYGVRRPTKKE